MVNLKSRRLQIYIQFYIFIKNLILNSLLQKEDNRQRSSGGLRIIKVYDYVCVSV